jgi:beta-1,4-N-acetylglucosaminyltransferase
VCHAGAGSVFEALRSRRAVLVVVNEALMDNHQVELAAALAKEGYLAYCLPSGLVDALAALQPHALQPYTPGSAAPVARAIHALCGFGAAQ